MLFMDFFSYFCLYCEHRLRAQQRNHFFVLLRFSWNLEYFLSKKKRTVKLQKSCTTSIPFALIRRKLNVCNKTPWYHSKMFQFTNWVEIFSIIFIFFVFFFLGRTKERERGGDPLHDGMHDKACTPTSIQHLHMRRDNHINKAFYTYVDFISQWNRAKIRHKSKTGP